MSTLDRSIAERDARIEKARPEFEKWSGYAHLAGWGWGNAAFERVRAARNALREWRYATNSRGADYEDVEVAVRVAADTFATEIESQAPDHLDVPTLRWVAAGLRCPAKPFCPGCGSCVTVTAPDRPGAEPS